MARFPLVPTAPEPERATLVGVEWRDNAWPLDRSLDVVATLVRTLCNLGSGCSELLFELRDASFFGLCCAELLLLLLRECHDGSFH